MERFADFFGESRCESIVFTFGKCRILQSLRYDLAVVEETVIGKHFDNRLESRHEQQVRKRIFNREQPPSECCLSLVEHHVYPERECADAEVIAFRYAKYAIAYTYMEIHIAVRIAESFYLVIVLAHCRQSRLQDTYSCQSKQSALYLTFIRRIFPVKRTYRFVTTLYNSIGKPRIAVQRIAPLTSRSEVHQVTCGKSCFYRSRHDRIFHAVLLDSLPNLCFGHTALSQLGFKVVQFFLHDSVLRFFIRGNTNRLLHDLCRSGGYLVECLDDIFETTQTAFVRACYVSCEVVFVRCRQDRLRCTRCHVLLEYRITKKRMLQSFEKVNRIAFFVEEEVHRITEEC